MENKNAKIDFKHIDIDFIINWCKENNEVEWLKAKAAEKVKVKKYPKIKVTRVKEDGTHYKTQIADKSQPYEEVEEPITFIQLKRAFCAKFMPELVPEAEEKKPTMWEVIANL